MNTFHLLSRLTLLLGLGLSASAQTGSITGTVTGLDGTTPLQDIQVTVYTMESQWNNWNSIENVQTGADGTYDLGGLPAGSYRVGFRDHAGTYASEFYDNAPKMEDAFDVNLGTGETKSGINASLTPAAHILGKVTGPDGTTPLQDIMVAVYTGDSQWNNWNSIENVSTGADGIYDLGGLPAGVYRVEFYDPNGIYASEYYDNALKMEDALDVNLGAGETKSGINASLTPAAHILGKVTGANGTTPLQGIEVTVYTKDSQWDYWNSIENVNTGADGTYDLGGLPAGVYRVEFHDPTGMYAFEYYDNALKMEDAFDVNLGTGETKSGINASLTPAAHILGKVTGPDGTTPLQDIQVTVYTMDSQWNNWSSIQNVQTGADGTYDLGGLPAGSYRVGFRDHAGTYASEFYDNAPKMEDAFDVNLGTGETKSGINASLTPAAHILGKVTGPDGTTPLQDIMVSVYTGDSQWNNWNSIGNVQTGGNGTYDLGGLPAGVYRVEFYDPNGIYASEYYDNALKMEDALDVNLGAGETKSGINASLTPAAHILGKVTGANGTTPLQGIEVTVYTKDSQWDYWNSIENVNTGTDGTYDLGGLPAGVYRVGFHDPTGMYAFEYYDNALKMEDAFDVNLGTGETKSGINASLTSAAHILGKVTGPDGTTPLQGIQVTVYTGDSQWNNWNSIQNVSTGADGTYDLGGLPAGVYRVGFRDQAGMYASEFYDNAPNLEDAIDVNLGAGETKSGVNASLIQAAHITGKVTGPNGTTPLQDIQVTVYTKDSQWNYWNSIEYINTGADGTYDLGGLPAGVYRVGFRDQAGMYASEYYDNAPSTEAAVDVNLSLGETKSGINASLTPAAHILGNVTGPNGTTPLQGIEVTVYTGDSLWNNWNSIENVTTGADGTYDLGGLPAGVYRVGFHDPTGMYADEFSENASDIRGALDVKLGVGETKPGIDASLTQGVHITGTVTGPDGTTPLQDVWVQAYVWNTQGEYWNSFGNGSSTDSRGAYDLGGLPPNLYHVRFRGGPAYVPEFYDNAPDAEGATDLILEVGETKSGINASLGQAAHITGKVTGPDGTTPLVNIEVSATVWKPSTSGGGHWDSAENDSTDSNGLFDVGSLAAGTYRLGYHDYQGNYVAEFWNNAQYVDDGDDILVGTGETKSGFDASLAAVETSAPPPEISAAGADASGVFSIQWQGVAGTAYQVMRSPALDQTFQNAPSGGGAGQQSLQTAVMDGLMLYRDPTNPLPGSAFYKVGKQ